MTVQEVRRFVEKSEWKEKFEKASVTITLAYTPEKIELNGIVAIFEYVERQYQGWSSIKEKLPEYLLTSREFYEQMYNKIKELLTSYDESYSSKREINELISSLSDNKYEYTRYEYKYLFQYDSPETKFLIHLENKFPEAISGAVSYLTNENIGDSELNSDFLTGVLQGYEFRNKDSEFLQRRNVEEKGLSALRTEYNSYIQKARIDLDEMFDVALTNKKEKFEKWFAETNKSFREFDKSAKDSILQNEDLYKEKLKLEAPANYWKQRATNLGTEGKKWMYWLIGATTLGVLSLGAVLYFISDGTLKDLFENKGSAIRWSVVFITFVSFLAFAVKTFAKLMFSAYHLHRDAEEREQLAYVYLSLKKDKSIDETERHLVMQSLFSRADSGLLKDDASPKMPGGSVLEKVISSK